jgi:hypothetical protein
MPKEIMMEVHWEKFLGGDFLLIQACVYLILCIFITCKTAVQVRTEAVLDLAVMGNKFFFNLKKLFLLAEPKNFKQSGLLIHRAKRPWHDGEGKMLNTDFKTYPSGLAIALMLKAIFDFNQDHRKKTWTIRKIKKQNFRKLAQCQYGQKQKSIC